MAASNLKPFVSSELADTTRLIQYRYLGNMGGGGVAHGIEARSIPQICNVWLKARRAGALHHKQEHLAAKAEIIMAGLAEVGIVALIDEVTGYQKTRTEDALSVLLKDVIAREMASWVKTFDDEFYNEIFRLKGCKMKATGPRPKWVGRVTNEIVYRRLGTGILEELQKKNPLVDGKRKTKHHQWLTRNVGYQRLQRHLGVVVAMMQVSGTWKEFEKRLNVVAPVNEIV